MNRGKFVCKNSFCARRFFVSEIRRRYGTTRAATTAAPVSVLPFSIPEPIERSPTDLLEALSSTVGTDVTAPHFSFIDDPATIPSSTRSKQQYYMCKEFGKRAARQLAEEWPTLFMFDRDQPRLPVFRPEKPLDPLVVDANEENLIKTIAARQVESAMALYERMGAGGVDVSAKTTLDLFNLACYYNGKDVPLDEVAEWHGLRNFHEVEPSTPQPNSNVELIFAAVEKSAHVYSAMICNVLKFFTTKSANRAIELFNEMLKKDFTPAEEVFNLLLMNRISILPQKGGEKSAKGREKFDVVAQLREMSRIGVRPSVRTFNAAISATFAINDLKARWEVIRPLVAEMNACGIPPNLTTFSNSVVACFTKWQDDDWKMKHPPGELHVANLVANFTLDELESLPTIELSEHTDAHYFSVLRQLAEYMNNVELLERAERIYSDPKNKVVFHSFLSESSFYTRYLYFKLDHMQREEFEKLYVAHVPRVASLSLALAYKICSKLKRKQLWSMTRRVIEDGLINGFGETQNASNEWQSLLVNFPTDKLSEAELDEYCALVKKLVNAWEDYNSYYDSIAERRQKFADKRAAEEEAANPTADGEDGAEPAAALVPQRGPPKEAASERSEARAHIDYFFFQKTMVERGFLKVLE